jgi:hypothetical protein
MQKHCLFVKKKGKYGRRVVGLQQAGAGTAPASAQTADTERYINATVEAARTWTTRRSVKDGVA